MRRTSELFVIGILLAGVAGCSGLSDLKHTSNGGGSGGSGSGTGSQSSSVVVSPAAVTVQPFGTQAFTAAVTGLSSSTVQWQVNGVVGGSQTTGLISSGGTYSAPLKIAPSLIPASGDNVTITVTAISAADSTVTGTATITLLTQQQAPQSGAAKMGTSGGNINDTGTGVCCAGTLGSLISMGGTQYILSNNHVLARSDGATLGDAISQPGLIETNCSTTGTQTVANLSQFFNLESGPAPKIDAALAQVASGKVDSSGSILLLGATQTNGVPDPGAPAQGSGILPTQAMAAPHNGLVAKSGRTTGLTCSTILAMNVSGSVDYYRNCGDTTVAFTVTYTDLVSVSGGDFSASGDSGSLIVTQDSAEAVALLFAGSDTDSVGNPVGDVLNAFAGNNGTPTFVGGTTHQVLGCSLTLTPAVAKAASPQVSAEMLRSASLARDLHAPELLGNMAVDAIGVGRSYDHPGQAAILLFVNSRGSAEGLPRSINGVSTRVIQAESWGLHGMLTDEESTQLLSNVAAPLVVYTLRAGELERAKAVQKAHQAEYLSQPGVLGVGITSSVDAPGEAALLIYVNHGASVSGIPVVIDGLRTRVRETSRFVAGRDGNRSNPSRGCRVPTSNVSVARLKP